MEQIEKKVILVVDSETEKDGFPVGKAAVHLSRLSSNPKSNKTKKFLRKTISLFHLFKLNYLNNIDFLTVISNDQCKRLSPYIDIIKFIYLECN